MLLLFAPKTFIPVSVCRASKRRERESWLINEFLLLDSIVHMDYHSVFSSVLFQKRYHMHNFYFGGQTKEKPD